MKRGVLSRRENEMGSRSCVGCRWFRYDSGEVDPFGNGECFRFPPQIVNFATFEAVYPAVGEGDTPCGEWALSTRGSEVKVCGNSWVVALGDEL